MCHLSMKLDPNPMHTSDKIVVKHISVKETLLKLDPEPIIEVGQQTSRMTRLITITARRFLASKSQFQLAILEVGYLGHRRGHRLM